MHHRTHGAHDASRMADLETRGLVGARGLSIATVIMHRLDVQFRRDRLRRRCLVNQRCDAPISGGLLGLGGELRELRIEIGERALQLFTVTRALAGLQLFFDACAG
jgi:hypothetical protein